MPRKGKKGGGKQVAVVASKKGPPTGVRRIRGKGDYGIGGEIGGKIGSWVGNAAQKLIQGITGMGDYKVKVNSFVDAGGPPVFGQNGRHDIIVCHREFVALVQSPGSAFNVTSYAINPSSNSFVWLPALAANFELFSFMGIVYEFKATSATAVSSTNTALGSVILATRYNALSPQFTSQPQMEAYEYSTSTVAFTSAIHPVECAPGENALSELYTDAGFAAGDPRFSILGILDVATVGQQAASTVGELWVSYHIRLIRPRLLGLVSTQGFTARYAAVNAATIAPTDLFATFRINNALNVSALATDNGSPPQPPFTGLPNSMSLDLVFGGGSTAFPANTIVFPLGVSGSFVIQFATTSANAVTLNIPALSGTNGLSLQQYQLSGATNYSYPANGSATTAQWFFSIGVLITPNPSGGNPTLTFSSTGVVIPSATPSSLVLQCFQINS